MENNVLWKNLLDKVPTYPPLKENIKTDVVIIGGGITGLTTALRLVQAGKSVVLLEALHIGDGTTGRSSCHLTTDVDESYSEIERKFDQKTAALVAESRVKAINLIEDLTRKYNIACDFRRLPGYLFTERQEELDTLRKEAEAAKRAGLKVKLLQNDLPFHWHVLAAVKFDDQAEFQSQMYLNGLADAAFKNGALIFEQTRALSIEPQGDYQMVNTTGGSVLAKEVVQATHIPLFINPLQTVAAPYRSYMLCYRLLEPIPKGLYWDMREPYNYIRTIEDEHGTILIAGGADHKTGTIEDTEVPFEAINDFVTKRYKVGDLLYKWSAQYYEPADGLPYIGKNPLDNRTYVATGFSGDGLVYGTVSAMIISDMILSIDNPWHTVYDATRFTPVASAADFVKENIDVAKNLIGERIKSYEAFDEVARGEGKIVEVDGKKVAVSRDEHDQLYMLSPKCTHMGCHVKWNSTEKSWDCPCHGSRFDMEGNVLTGPTTQALKKEHSPEKVNAKKRSE